MPDSWVRYGGRDGQVFLAESAASSVATEMELHRGFLARSGVTEEDIAQGERSPTCLGYTNLLLATAHAHTYEVKTPSRSVATGFAGPSHAPSQSQPHVG
jgi:hypothetical protein